MGDKAGSGIDRIRTNNERLEVLYPGSPANYDDEFGICPSEAMRQRLNQAQVLVENWHGLMPLKPQERSVVKEGRESDVALVRRVLGPLATQKNIVVVNDEAHHAYRVPVDVKVSRKVAAEQGIDLDEATRWIEGLDRIHEVLRVQRCFDLSCHAVRADRPHQHRTGAVRLDHRGFRPERRHRSRAREDAARRRA